MNPEAVGASSQADSSSEELILSPLQPQRWTDYIEQHGEVSLSVVANQLHHLQIAYVPVFEAGEPRQRLRRYLPGLRELIQNASWVSGDARHWDTEDEARADLLETLETLADLM